MTKVLPSKHPAEVLAISPEALEVANCYLEYQSIEKVSEDLEIPTDIIATILAKAEVKAYINQVFLDTGFNNRFKMRKVLDSIIAKKLEEMDEAEIGSSKDIMEILALSHKFTMEQMDKEIQLEKIRSGSVKTQINIQQNNTGSPYQQLLDKLINSSSNKKDNVVDA